jgi:hypothetical protein
MPKHRLTAVPENTTTHAFPGTLEDDMQSLLCWLPVTKSPCQIKVNEKGLTPGTPHTGSASTSFPGLGWLQGRVKDIDDAMI